MILARQKEAIVFSKKSARATLISQVLTALLYFFVSYSPLASEDPFKQINDHYQALLDDHVSAGQKNGLQAQMVDYAAVRKDPRLEELQALLKDFPKELLNTNDKKVAFYLNAYNILAIAMVADNWPLKQLKSLGTMVRPVWTHSTGRLCGEKMTLRILERNILRKLDEPRIHFALNCASMSCPDLRFEPYQADIIDQQLAEQTKLFMAQSGKGMSVDKNEIRLSPLFDWFDKDFEILGGVDKFIKPYLPESNEPWKIAGYFDYDWDVNDHLDEKEIRQINKRKRNRYDR